MNHQDLIYTSVFEQIQRLLFSDLSGPLSYLFFNNAKLCNSIQSVQYKSLLIIQKATILVYKIIFDSS